MREAAAHDAAVLKLRIDHDPQAVRGGPFDDLGGVAAHPEALDTRGSEQAVLKRGAEQAERCEKQDVLFGEGRTRFGAR